MASNSFATSRNPSRSTSRSLSTDIGPLFLFLVAKRDKGSRGPYLGRAAGNPYFAANLVRSYPRQLDAIREGHRTDAPTVGPPIGRRARAMTL
jgi:hypothetical protein